MTSVAATLSAGFPVNSSFCAALVPSPPQWLSSAASQGDDTWGVAASTHSGCPTDTGRKKKKDIAVPSQDTARIQGTRWEISRQICLSRERWHALQEIPGTLAGRALLHNTKLEETDKILRCYPEAMKPLSFSR